MYCVIQEIEIKKAPAGEAKEIKVYETAWTINGENGSVWGYRYSDEHFDRPVRKAYRISIHESYREGGKVKKKQTVICTIGYYSIVDWGSWVGDYIVGGLKRKADALGLTEEALSDLIYQKFRPIVDRVEAEFQQTEEYKAREEHGRILKEHRERVKAFKEKYDVGDNEYDQCYDVFGTLRNPDALKRIIADHKARKEYERRSRRESRSYYEHFYSNYNSTGSSGDRSGSSGNPSSARSGDNRDMLKKFYRTLSKAYHPDSNPGVDTSEEMKFLNQLKSDWGV